MKTSILLVEDNPLVRDTLAAQLIQFGCDVSCASDGLRGLKMIQAQRFDAVLIDQQMPIMDGITLLRNVTAMPKQPDCYLMCTEQLADVTPLLDGLHVKGVLAKPLGTDDIRLILARSASATRAA